MDFNCDCARAVLFALEKMLTDKEDSFSSPWPENKGESQNTDKIVQGNSWGYELVAMTTHSPTCAICAMYQGRVYATTREAANGKYRTEKGTVLRFPYLYDTAFANGGNTIHPNCRHRIALFPWKAYTEEELQHYLRISNAPFEDNRSEEEKLRYDIQQAKLCIKREQRKLYETIQQVLPDEAPKSFSGFVRMETADSVKYRLLIKTYEEKHPPVFLHKITFHQLINAIQEPSYPPQDILRSLEILHQEKMIYINSSPEAVSIDQNTVIYDITYKGRQMLHRIRSNIIWKKATSDLITDNIHTWMNIFRSATNIIYEKSPTPIHTASSVCPVETTAIQNISHQETPSPPKSSSLPNGWHISVSFSYSSSPNFARALYLAKQAPHYNEQNYAGQIIYQATYGKEPEQYLAFIQLYEMIQNWKSTAVFINGKSVDRKIIGGLNYCYGDKCRSCDPDFCFGASFMTKNPFGCHRLQVSACNHPWWTFNRLIGNYYYINKNEIKSRIHEYSRNYVLCPSFDEKRIQQCLDHLPDRITKQQYDELLRRSSLGYTTNIHVNPQSTPSNTAPINTQGMPINHNTPSEKPESLSLEYAILIITILIVFFVLLTAALIFL